MSSPVNWNITPAQFLTELGIKYRQRAAWLAVDKCPFCEGGDHRDRFTFIVHGTDGNYSCSRGKCSVSGSFWGLIEAMGKDVSNYRGERQDMRIGKKKKRFIYGK